MSDQHHQDASSENSPQSSPRQDVESTAPDTPIGDLQALDVDAPSSQRSSSDMVSVASSSSNDGNIEPDRASTVIEEAPDAHKVATHHSSRTAIEPKSSSDTRLAPHKGSTQRRSHQLVYQWIWEILSCFVSILCLVSIVAVLGVHRDQPLPQWPKMISINSLISIFTALMRAAVIFPVAQGISQAKWLWFRRQPRTLIEFEQLDSASRGPWGSFLLLTKARKNYLASMGALLTIVALTIDPFSQQIVRYYNCDRVDHHSVASIPRTNNYTGRGLMTRPQNAELDTTMAGVIYMGLLASPANENAILAFDCRTGNCTFPTDRGASISTLGMCQHVVDISDTIRRNESYPGYWIPDWDGNSECSVGLFTPNGTEPYQMLFTRKTIAKNPDFDDLITFDILTLNVDDGCDMSRTDNCTKHPFAARHSLYPCIQTLYSNITQAQVHESLVSSVPLKKTNASAITITDSENLTWSLATNETLRDGKWVPCSPSTSPSPNNMVAVSLNGTVPIVSSATEPVHYYPDDCVWLIDYLSALALNQFGSWMFDYSPLTARTEDTVATTGPPWLKTYYRNGTVDLAWAQQYMAGLANSITIRMRQSGETPPSGYAQGEVLQSQTCIHVQWAWLSLPIAVIMLTIAFLVATIVSCAGTETWCGAWTSSALAALFSGFDDTARVEAEKTTSKIDMEERAKGMVVQMTKTEGGVRFVLRDDA